MTTEFKYLDYEGLKLFKNLLEHLRLADKTDIVEVLNEISNGIHDGKLSLYINGVLLNEFTANQEGNTEANIIVPTELGDLNNSVEFIKNVIKYGQPDVSDLTDDQKESLHNQTSEDSGLVSEDSLETTLASYGTAINYDTEHQKIQLLHNNTVLSEIDASDFIKDSMILDISVADGTGDNLGQKVLLIDFNTDSGINDIEIPISEFFNPDNYYVKDDFAAVATSGNYNDLSNVPSTLTQEEINLGTNSDGKLVTAKIIRDSIDSAITGGNSKVITDDNLSEKVLAEGFAKSVLVGNNLPTIADVNGVLFVPEQKQTDWSENNINDKAYIKNKPTVYNLSEIQNIVKYGQADISELTDEEKTLIEQESGFVKNSDLAVVAKTGSYSDLLNVPTNVSSFTNDSGYITNLNIKGKVDREINGSNGKALVFNEYDGGGVKFEHNDGTFSFVGVNDGGSDGIAGQIYAVKKINEKNTGSRIDITKDAIYYTVGNDSVSERLVPKNEIATKNDIDLKIEYISNGSITLSNYYNKTLVNNILNDLPQSDWSLTDDSAKDYIKNKPTIYSQEEILNIIKYGLSDVSEMTDELKEQAQNTSDYALKSDLFSKNYNDLTNKPDLFSGSWNDLTDKPTIPEGSVVDATFDKNSGNAVKNSTITTYIQDTLPNEIKNIVEYGVSDVTGKTELELEQLKLNSDFALKSDIPTKTSDLTNDSNFLTSHQDISGKADSATTLAGYGITDAKIENGTIILGNDTITPLTEHQSLSNYYTQDLINNLITYGSTTVPEEGQELDPIAKKSDIIQSDWNQSDNTKSDYILNKPTVYSQTEIENIIKYGQSDISGLTPELVELALNNSEYALKSEIPDISGKANTADLATVATSGSYNDLVDLPENIVTTENISTAVSNYFDTPSNKPSYVYSEIEYNNSTRTSISGAVTIDPTIPVHYLTLTGNVSSIVFTSGKIMEDGHSVHVFLYSTAARTIAVNSNTTISTVSGTNYISLTPDNKAMSLSLTVNSSKGYVEIDFLRVGTTILVRGV